MKKYLFILIALSSLSFLFVFIILQNYLLYSQLRKDGEKYLTQTINDEEIDRELPQKIIQNLEKINKIDIKKFDAIKSISNDLLTISKKFLNEDQRYLVVLQNSDELRATGGFLGSFFVLETAAGRIRQPIIIQDIYVPDGQFQGFIQAPKGLAEYLSSGKGMRLPDANWWPNFPDSATQILYFFQNIDKKNYDGVIAINLQLVEDLLDLTGEIYLPDYKQSVNKSNFAQIARADRLNFFPGSQEKANFLNHFLKMFKIKLVEIIKENPQQFISLIEKTIKNKNVQIYSSDAEIAEILNRRKLDGEMHNEAQQLYYFLVESNVGINKANRLVNRQVLINLRDDGEELEINFQNNNQFPYINYQRIYTNQNTDLSDLQINGQKVTQIDQRVMTSSNGENWQEIGFLIPILANSQSLVQIKLHSRFDLAAKRQIFIQKQAGLKEVEYTLNYQDQSKTLQLDSDQLILFD